MIKRLRIYQRLYAFLYGYFWLPCDLCGEKYGGHEKGQGYLQTSWSVGRSTCPNCKERASQMNRDNDYFKPDYMLVHEDGTHEPIWE